MKEVRLSEEQMVSILREADPSPVAGIARKHTISEQTICAWRRRLGHLEPADVRRMRDVEAENVKLQRMTAERKMAIGTLEKINRRRWRARRTDGTARPWRWSVGSPSTRPAS